MQWLGTNVAITICGLRLRFQLVLEEVHDVVTYVAPAPQPVRVEAEPFRTRVHRPR